MDGQLNTRRERMSHVDGGSVKLQRHLVDVRMLLWNLRTMVSRQEVSLERHVRSVLLDEQSPAGAALETS